MARRSLPLAAATLGLALAAPGAQGAVLQCGDVITASTRLDNDLVGCPGPNTLVVRGANVQLNLNGKELIGSGTGTGILVDASSTGARVANGRVSGFATGVRVDADSATLVSLGVDHNTEVGVDTIGFATVVRESYFDRNGIGILVNGIEKPKRSSDVVVQANTIMRSARQGIYVFESPKARVIKNTVGQNAQGIRCLQGYFSSFDRNYVADNDGDGITGQECTGSTFTNNDLLRNTGAGFVGYDAGFDVIGNVAGNNGGTGFVFFTNFHDPQYTRFQDNRSTDNGGWGFSLDVGTTDLGGNVARRNALGAFTYGTP